MNTQAVQQKAEAPQEYSGNGIKPFIFEDHVLGKMALFHSPTNEAYVTVEFGQRWQSVPVKSDQFENWIARRFYSVQGDVPPDGELKKIIRRLTWFALFDGPEIPVHIRYAKVAKKIYVDLCDDDGHFVEIDSESYKIGRHNIFSIPFIRTPSMKAQVLPKEGGSISALAHFLNVQDEEQFGLGAGFILSAMNPDVPSAILILYGPQGSSKSTTTRIIRSIVDPSIAPLASEPGSIRNLFISSSHEWLGCFDNISFLSSKMLDAFCRLTSGATYRTRKNYTNTQETIIKVKRPVVFNSIAPFTQQNDFLDRSICLELPPIPAFKRKPEQEFREEWEAARPLILGAFFRAVSLALRNFDDIECENPPRLADVARWVIAAEPACPWKPGMFMQAYRNNRTEIVDSVIESDPVAKGILELMNKNKKWLGTATSLLDALKSVVRTDHQKVPEWPKSPAALSSRLRRLEGFLSKKGVQRTKDRTSEKRLITLKKTDSEKKSNSAPSNEIKSVIPPEKEPSGGGHESQPFSLTEGPAEEVIQSDTEKPAKIKVISVGSDEEEI